MHADTITTWSGLHPDTPHQCVSAQCGFRFSFRFLVDSARYARSSTCGERDHRMLSVIPVLFFGDESPDSPSNALKSSQTHETGFRCPPGHGRREKRLQRLSGGQARRYPLTRGFQVARNRASPCKAHLHGTGSHAVGRWS